MTVILLAASMPFSSCQKIDDNFPDGHSEIKKVSDMLYEVTYSDYSDVLLTAHMMKLPEIWRAQA